MTIVARALLLLAMMLPACGPATAQAPLPTAHIRARSNASVVVLPTLAATPAPAAPAHAALPTALPAASAPTPAPATAEAQYRAWMEEARLAHPYAESVDRMWDVMLCESGGQPEASNGINIGLFQYHPDTWAGAWNPYRDQSILDPRSQIFATAKAWQDGYQQWWSCYFMASQPDHAF